MEENKSRFRASPQEWRALLEELAAGEMSTAAFCRDRAIPAWQMRHRLRKDNAYLLDVIRRLPSMKTTQLAPLLPPEWKRQRETPAESAAALP